MPWLYFAGPLCRWNPRHMSCYPVSLQPLDLPICTASCCSPPPPLTQVHNLAATTGWSYLFFCSFFAICLHMAKHFHMIWRSRITLLPSHSLLSPNFHSAILLNFLCSGQPCSHGHTSSSQWVLAVPAAWDISVTFLSKSCLYLFPFLSHADDSPQLL